LVTIVIAVNVSGWGAVQNNLSVRRIWRVPFRCSR